MSDYSGSTVLCVFVCMCVCVCVCVCVLAVILHTVHMKVGFFKCVLQQTPPLQVKFEHPSPRNPEQNTRKQLLYLPSTYCTYVLETIYIRTYMHTY